MKVQFMEFQQALASLAMSLIGLDLNQDLDFENFDAYQLNEVLRQIYLDLRHIDGELYTFSSLENTRYGLYRYLKTPPFLKKFDIIKNP